MSTSVSLHSTSSKPCDPPPGSRGIGEVKMVEQCGHCGSRDIIDDIDRVSRITERKCRMCSRKNIEMVPASSLSGVNNKQEGSVSMGTFKSYHKPCKNHPDKYAVAEDLCAACFKESHGVSYNPRTYWGKKTVKAGEPLKPTLKTEKPEARPKPAPKPPKPTREKKEEESGKQALNTVVVNFDHDMDLLEKLSRLSAVNFRIREQQILYLISQAALP